jgi:hypothetical protein
MRSSQMSGFELEPVIPLCVAHPMVPTQLLSPEANLLCLLARLEIDQVAGTHIQRLVNRGIDWPLFKPRVENHRLIPLVFRHFRDLFEGIAPPELMVNWGATSRRIAVRNVLLANELTRILGLCSAQGIQIIPYKGPVLAAWIYGDLSLRTICDLDIIVRPSDVQAVKELLQTHNYRAYWSGSIDSPLSEESSHLVFNRPDLDITLEVHWALAPSNFPLGFRGPRIWQNLEARRFGQIQVLTHSVTDLLLILAIHAGKHHWSRLSWIVDMAELIRQDPTIQWSRLLREAVRYRCRRILQVSLWLAWTLLDAPVPECVRLEWRKDPAVSAIGAQVVTELAKPNSQELSTWRFRWSIREDLRDRIEQTVRLVMAPTEADERFLRLPSGLEFLYPALRAFRLLLKYAWRNPSRRAQR